MFVGRLLEPKCASGVIYSEFGVSVPLSLKRLDPLSYSIDSEKPLRGRETMGDKNRKRISGYEKINKSIKFIFRSWISTSGHIGGE